MSTDPVTPELNGIWSQILPKLKDDVEVFFGDEAISKKDVQRLMECTCRDEELIGASAMLIQALRKKPDAHVQVFEQVDRLIALLHSRGRLL